jgi:hypothetical protein
MIPVKYRGLTVAVVSPVAGSVRKCTVTGAGEEPAKLVPRRA